MPASASSPSSTSLVDRGMSMLHLDFAPSSRAPSVVRLALATVLSIGLSLLVDAALVAIGTRVFPATKGYGHFRFHDYARLTIIGIVIACAAWPIVNPGEFGPSLAVLPGRHRGHRGAPTAGSLHMAPRATGESRVFLMLMHLAIG